MTTSLHVSRHASESRPDLQGQQLPMDQTYSDFNDSVLDDKNFHADIGKDSEVLDIDVRFSDMSDIPPEPEQTRPKAAVGIDPQPKQQTMLNLVYRPESAGNDNCVVFNIMPSNCKLMKRPDCGNTRTNNGFVPVVASTADDDQVIRSCEIRSCEENPYQGLCRTGKTQISESRLCPGDGLLPKSQPEQNVIDNCSAERSQPGAISRAPQQYSHRSQDGSRSISQVDDRSQSQQSIHDVQLPAEGPSVNLEPSTDRPDTIVVSDDAGPTNNKSIPLRNTDSVQRQCESHHAQTIQKDNYRISKPVPVPLLVKKTSGQGARVDGTPPSVTGLSEEDLLYFLMYQIRQRDQKNSTFVQQQAQLEKENKILQNIREILKKQLEDTEDEKNHLAGEAEHIRNELDLFKNKYKKLKNWALEMNNEYANIRQEGRALKNSLSDLRQESSDMWKPVKDTLASNNAAVKTIQNVKKSIVGTAQSMGMLNGSLKAAQEDLASANTEVHILRDTRDKYELYIRELSASQNKLNLRVSSHQSKLIETLDTFNQKLDATQPRPSELSKLNECMDLVRKLSDKDIATNAGVDDLKRTVTMLSEQLQTFSIKLENSAQASRSCTVPDSLAVEFASVLNAIKELQPNMAKFEGVQHENIRLQEQARSDKKAIKSSEEAKRAAERAAEIAAESRQAIVERNNEKLVSSLAQCKEHQQNLLSETASELRTQLSTITIKWMSASSELKANRNKAALYEQELNDLRQQLQDCEDQPTTAEKEKRLQHQKDIELIKRDNANNEANLRATFEQQIRQLNESEAISTQAFDNMQREKDSEQKRLHQLQQEKNDLHQTLEDSRQESSRLTTNLDEQMKANLDLEQRFKEVCEQASHTATLEQRLAEKCTIIDEMKASIEAFDGIKAQLGDALADSSSKDSKICQLNDEVAAFDQMTCDFAQLGRKVAEQQKELASQRDKLIIAEATAVTLQKTEDELKKSVEDMHRVQELLGEAQIHCLDLQEAEKKATRLQEDTDKLKAELAVTKAHSFRVPILEDLIRQRDGKIMDLEEQVSNLGRLENDLKAVQLHLADKDKQLEAQTNEIEDLIAQTQQPSQCQGQTQRDHLDELFTQNTNLSMSTSSLPYNQKMNDKGVQVSSVTIQVADSSLLTVNPSATLTTNSAIQPTNMSIVGHIASSQTSIIPDSQLDLVAQLCDDFQALPTIPLNNRSASSLTDIDDEYIDSDIEIEDSCPKHISPSKLNLEGDEQDDIFNFPNSSPQEPVRNKTIKILPHRPSSAPSQEEMLLQSIDGQKNRSPRATLSHHSHSRTRVATSQEDLAPPQSAQADPVDSNRHRLRKSSQRPRADAYDNRAAPFERALPNSAAKRRIDEVATRPDERSMVKRTRIDTAPTEMKSSGRLRRTTVAEATPGSADNLPAGSRIGEPAELSVLSANKNGKRSKTTRKSTKQTHYGEKFNNKR